MLAISFFKPATIAGMPRAKLFKWMCITKFAQGYVLGSRYASNAGSRGQYHDSFRESPNPLAMGYTGELVKRSMAGDVRIGYTAPSWSIVRVAGQWMAQGKRTLSRKPGSHSAGIETWREIGRDSRDGPLPWCFDRCVGLGGVSS